MLAYGLLFYMIIFISINLSSISSPENQIEQIELEIPTWQNKSFLKYGVPLYYTSDKNVNVSKLSNRSGDLVAVPHFECLMNELQDEDNVLVQLQNADDVIPRLYQDIFPNRTNYAIKFLEHTVEKCHGEESACEKLEDCTEGLIGHNGNHTWNNIIFIAKNTGSKLETEILVQYHDRLIRCRDTKDPIKIKRLVLQLSQNQNVTTLQNNFKYTETLNETTVIYQNLDLFNKSLHLHILQCGFCQADFNLQCGNTPTNKSVSNQNGTLTVLKNGEEVQIGWQEVVFNGTSDHDECSLSITTRTTNPSRMDQVRYFWAIFPRGILKPENFPVRFSPTTTTNRPENSKIDNQSLSGQSDTKQGVAFILNSLVLMVWLYKNTEIMFLDSVVD